MYGMDFIFVISELILNISYVSVRPPLHTCKEFPLFFPLCLCRMQCSSVVVTA